MSKTRKKNEIASIGEALVAYYIPHSAQRIFKNT